MKTINQWLAAVAGGTIESMTAKEKLLERAPSWSEAQAEAALRAAEGESTVDGWGDFSKLHEVTTKETMRRLAVQERSAGHKPW